ncbi:hypothetical protein [Paenibacillus sp. NEAU-GSW1]|uniref:hypothetical protein n=1 Tax=Paenibacillus sp. NEAU-GSW1 TaxID=2682486 RepID=UPI0012E274ED|nr:hypothetical protein [Paenibacillus sp. NEAU-GSW1]MUT66258.1 hypothetical protein [Paenibacillus sp. NEAU-GSW1]
MISEEQLDHYRVSGEKVRVVRDEMEANDVIGIVVAWDDETVVLRKANKRVLKLSRSYRFEPAAGERGSVL